MPKISNAVWPKVQMNNISKIIEEALMPLAEKITPKGSEARAVIHQWTHAICSQTDLVGGIKKADAIKAL